MSTQKIIKTIAKDVQLLDTKTKEECDKSKNEWDQETQSCKKCKTGKLLNESETACVDVPSWEYDIYLEQYLPHNRRKKKILSIAAKITPIPTQFGVILDKIAPLTKPTSFSYGLPVYDTPVQQMYRTMIYTRGKTLGTGSQGTVSSACTLKVVDPKDNTKVILEPQCTFVWKDAMAKHPDELYFLARDPYFLHKLDGVTINQQKQRITPRLYDAFILPDEKDKTHRVITISEQFDGDLLRLAKDRDQNHEEQYFFKHELLTMFQIAYKLGKLKIIHGDLKADQFLYKLSKQKRPHGAFIPADTIVITDFGFTGGPNTAYPALSGWNSNQNEGCPNAYEPVEETCATNVCGDDAKSVSGQSKNCSEEFFIHTNVSELEQYLIKNTRTYVVENDSKTGRGKIVGFFSGIRNGLKRGGLGSSCPNYTSTKWRHYVSRHPGATDIDQQTNQELPEVSFDMKELQV